MRTASLFKNGQNQAIRLPKAYEFDGVKEVDLRKEGDALIITPHRKSWASLLQTEKADNDYLADREEILDPEYRVEL